YNRFKKIMLTDNKWNLMSDLTNLFRPFNEYTEYFSSSEYVTISIMYPLITTLIAKFCPIIQDFYSTLNFNSNDIAFDDDLEYKDNKEETIIGPKKQQIKINRPMNTTDDFNNRELNGREIRNVLHATRLLAKNKDKSLTAEFIIDIIKIIQEFHSARNK
ncbi:11247_t:CDS:2, partial [Racocetra fulgida]